MKTQQRSLKADSDSARVHEVTTLLSIACPAWFLGANAVLHLLRRDLSPVTHYISEYAVGRYGGVMASALVTLGVGTLSLSSCLARTTKTVWLTRVGVVLLSISGVSTILIGLFRTDIDGHGPTLAGRIHGRAAIVAIVLEAVSVLLFTAHFFRDGRWHSFRAVSGVFAVMTVIAGALYPVIAHGTGERLLVYTLVAWLLAAGIQSRRVGPIPLARPPLVGAGAGMGA